MNVVIDGQWGSTGKGKLCAWLADRWGVSLSITNNGPNAGHTVVLDDGTKRVFKQLPSACIFPTVRGVLGPGSVIDKERVAQEIEECGQGDFLSIQGRFVIDPHAAVVSDLHKRIEQKEMGFISSTMQGTGACIAEKVMRKAILAKDVPALKYFIGPSQAIVRTHMDAGEMVLAEGSQGFCLSLNHGQYPYVTSRDVTTAQVLNDCGVPPRLVGTVYGSLRCHPIRVGHQLDPKTGEKVGDSGPHYPDQKEMTWEEVGVPPERTTVTNKIRRVFSFSLRQFSHFAAVCGPDRLFVNFVNYLDRAAEGRRTWAEMPEKVREFCRILNPTVPVALLGTGPRLSEMVEL